MIVATSYAGADAVARSSSLVAVIMLQRSSRVWNHVRRPEAAWQADSRLPALTAGERNSLARCDGSAEARLARRRPRERLHAHASLPAGHGGVLRVVHDPVLGGIRRGDEAGVTHAEHALVPGEHGAALHPVLGFERIRRGVAQAELSDRVLLQPRIACGVKHEDAAAAPEELWPFQEIELGPALPALVGRAEQHAVGRDRPRIRQRRHVELLWCLVGCRT